MVIQTLFICTGCDFVSFFNGLGKATFLGTLNQYSAFITADQDSAQGILTTEQNSLGLLAFTRLVGCAYFKKHKSAFLPTYPTPMALYNSISSTNDQYTQHNEWLDLIRNRMWTRIQFEDDMIPSSSALSRHWK